MYDGARLYYMHSLTLKKDKMINVVLAKAMRVLCVNSLCYLDPAEFERLRFLRLCRGLIDLLRRGDLDLDLRLPLQDRRGDRLLIRGGGDRRSLSLGGGNLCGCTNCTLTSCPSTQPPFMYLRASSASLWISSMVSSTS